METTKTPSVKREKIDPSIESALPENCNLSILFQEDGLVFSILRNDLKKFIVLGEYEAREGTNVESLFHFREQLQGNFANFVIGFQSPEFTLVPASLFHADKISEYATFQFDTKNTTIYFDTLSTHGLVVVYALPQQLPASVAKYFQGARLQHSASLAIAHYLDVYKNKPGEHIHVNIWRNTVEIIAVKNSKLLLCNMFTTETNEDLLYFILNCYEQLGLNPESVPLKISGEIEKGSAAWNLLLTYIRFVETEEQMQHFSYSHEFKSLPSHQFNRVFQAATCVL